MAVAANAKPLSLAEDDTKARSYWADTWVQFSANRLAIVGLVIVIALILLAVTADFWRGLGLIENPTTTHQGTAMASAMTCATDNQPNTPQYCYLFGSDFLGRDIFSRMIYGTRVSLAVGIVGTAIAISIGTLYGLVSGYFGGWVDNLMMRLIDFMYGVPDLVLIILMQVFFKTLADYSRDPAYRDSIGPIGLLAVDIDRWMSGLFFLFVALSLLSWIGVARQTRGQILSYKQKEFVEAARSVGARNHRIILVHLLPNIIGPLIVIAALSVPGFIFTEAVLSVLGLGVNPPTPSWGQLINFAYEQDFRSNPAWVLGPGGLLALTTLAFTFLGDGLRDAFDPRLRGSK